MNRNKIIKFRVTDKEEQEIRKHAEKAKMTLSDYLRKSAVMNNITVIDTGELYRLNTSLRRIGVNINQVAAVANSTNNIYAKDVSDLREQVDMIAEEVRNYFGRMVQNNGDNQV